MNYSFIIQIIRWIIKYSKFFFFWKPFRIIRESTLDLRKQKYFQELGEGPLNASVISLPRFCVFLVENSTHRPKMQPLCLPWLGDYRRKFRDPRAGICGAEKFSRDYDFIDAQGETYGLSVIFPPQFAFFKWLGLIAQTEGIHKTLFVFSYFTL